MSTLDTVKLNIVIKKFGDLCRENKKVVPPGPWNEEPDRYEFYHKDFPCLLLRNAKLLHWCGYVGVPISHPFFGISYGALSGPGFPSVHGGFTYSGKSFGLISHHGAGDTWWFGFDCAHAYDLIPMMLHYGQAMQEVGKPKRQKNDIDIYRSFEWVVEETKKLADQLGEKAQ